MINFFEKIHVTDAEIYDLFKDDPFLQIVDRTIDPAGVGIMSMDSPERIKAHLRLCDTCHARALLIQWMLPEVIIATASIDL